MARYKVIRTYHHSEYAYVEANSEEEAKLNYKLNGKIVDSIESDYLEEDHYNLEIEKAN